MPILLPVSRHYEGGRSKKGKKRPKKNSRPVVLHTYKGKLLKYKGKNADRRLESANSRSQDAIARGFSGAQRALALALSGLCAEGILALESVCARLGKEGLWFGSRLKARLVSSIEYSSRLIIGSGSSRERLKTRPTWRLVCCAVPKVLPCRDS